MARPRSCTSRDIAKPEIGDDEVLVRVHAASIHVGDWILMTGSPFVMRLATGLRKPKNPVPGTDIAGHGRGGRRGGHAPSTRRRGLRMGYGRLRGVRAGQRGPSHQEAGQPHLRAGGRRRGLGIDRAPAPPRRRGGPARAEGPDQRSVRWRRHLRGPDREGPRCRGDRRDQHAERRAGPLPRCRPRRRLHPAGLHRGGSAATT